MLNFIHPITGQLYIETPNTMETFYVNDIFGRRVIEENGTKLNEKSTIPWGTYIVQVTSGGKAYFSKFIKR